MDVQQRRYGRGYRSTMNATQLKLFRDAFNVKSTAIGLPIIILANTSIYLALYFMNLIIQNLAEYLA
jgi:hypothetical protein